MKSKTEQLEKRGYIVEGVESKYSHASFEQRSVLLKSKLATERTLGARLLAKNSNQSAINYLIDALRIEKKLYPKIEICNSLVSYGKEAVIPLINVLGKIGNNQHREIPESDFKKDNYPLPRDIAGRTLIRIGTISLAELLKLLDNKDVIKLSEAIDVIGYICYYNYRTGVFENLKECFNRNCDNNLIKWKIFRAMSAFPESEIFLKEQLNIKSNSCFNIEIHRSLTLIHKKNN